MGTRGWVRGSVRVLGELFVIVAGVLIALSADAWIENRSEREAEVRHLRALEEDLQESLRLLDEANGQRSRMSHALVEIADGNVATADPDSIRGWIVDGLLMVYGYQPRLASLTDLQSSDQLRLLPSQVRREIAELERRLSALSAIEDDFLASQQRLMDPYLVERLPLASVLAEAEGVPLSAALGAAVDIASLEAEVLRNAIAFKLSLGSLATARRADVLEQMEVLLELVEQRLVELAST